MLGEGVAFYQIPGCGVEDSGERERERERVTLSLVHSWSYSFSS